MHSRQAALAAVLAPTLFASLAAAQPPPTAPMPRDRAPVAREGTAVLGGRVVDGATGTAVPRARVRLMGRGGPRPSVLTDANGSFSFGKLPAGPYSLGVEKSTYLPTQFPAMGRTVRSRMQPLVLRDGETLQSVTVPLYRGGAIAGRVVDAHGDPIEHAQVQVLRVPAKAGRRRPDPRGGTQTNDIGEFRVGRLEPGTYLLLAMVQRSSHEDMLTGDTPAAQPIPTYYPGVLSAEQALPITLERGQQVTGIDFALAEGTPSIVTGTVVTAEGTPLTTRAFVSARPVRSSFGGMFASGRAMAPSGTFRIQLSPGEYVLEAHVENSGQQSPGQETYGIAQVSVGEGAVQPVVIVVGRGATATGRVVFEGTAPLPAIPAGLRLPLRDDGGACRSGQVQVNADWTFRVEGLMGTCIAPGWEVTFGRWTLKNVLVDGEDVLRKKITFEPGQRLRNVQVTLTDRRTSIAFAVSDDTGQRTREYVALVIPADKSSWTADTGFVRTYAPPSARFATASASPRREMLPMLTPGEYFVVAVDDLEIEAMQDPEVIERLIPSAVRVAVVEGTTTEVSLRRVKSD